MNGGGWKGLCWMWSVVAVSGCLVGVDGLLAQSEGENLEIRGVVMLVGTRQPVPNVQVRLTQQSPGPTRTSVVDEVTADGNGRFAFMGLSAGRYTVGSVATYEGEEVSDANRRQVTVSSDGLPLSIPLWTSPISRISGQVLDDEGNPIVGAAVRLQRRAWGRGGEWRLERVSIPSPSNQVLTDDDGRYILPAPAGTAYLEISATNRELFAPRYYPGVASLEEAIPITVLPGRDLASLDVRLDEDDALYVTLHVPLDEEVVRGLESLRRDALPLKAYLRWSSGFGLDVAMYEVQELVSLGNDVYRIGPLSPGVYEVGVNYTTWVTGSLDRDWDQLDPIASFEVSLDDRDVDVGTVQIAPHQRISGGVRLRATEPSDFDFDQIGNVAIIDHFSNVRQAPVGPDGDFVLSGVSAGLFEFNLPKLPTGWYVASVMSGGRNVGRDGLLVGGMASPIEVQIASGGARVQGVARDRSSALIPDARIVLIPPVDRRGPMTEFPTTRTDDTGAYGLDSVPPGRYRALMIDVAGREGFVRASDPYWQSPDFLRRYEPLAEAVTVDPSVELLLDLELIAFD